jgi:hypothetical protein
MTHYTKKASQIGDMILFGCSIVESKHLFVNVSVQMERLDTDVCTFQAPLEKAPEIFESVCVNLTVNVAFGMLNHLMRKAIGSAFCASVVVGGFRLVLSERAAHATNHATSPCRSLSLAPFPRPS